AASDRAVLLILQAAGGEAGKMADIQSKKMPPVKISVRPQKVNDLLGIEVPQKKMVSILKSLGLVSTASGKGKLGFIAPSWRQDLKKEIDLVEEIVRIYGYEKIPVAAPKDIGVLYRENIPKELEYQTLVRDALVSFGLDEILTYSLVRMTDDELCQEVSARPRIHLKNPLSLELATLRTNLITGVLLTVKRNLNRGLNDIKIFEIGPVYATGKIGEQEDSHLIICLSGIRTDNWEDGTKLVDFYYLKGIIEGLFKKVGIENYKIRPTPSIGSKIFDDTEKRKIDIDTNGQPNEIGVFGKVRKELLGKLDIEKDCFLCQINLNAVYKHICLDKKFLPLPKFPAVYRDISTLVKQDIQSDKIVKLMEETAGGILKDIKLFDVYRGQQIPKGHKSLIYRLTYQSPDKTLTDAEVETVHSKITSLLKEKLGVQIR
ncbi:MAG: phenylalanine--tRNA ligase subunit beta, partial [Candidatus Omnitrophica bacterium]|nr:phenylalanine--tRNA ligase subunit beta [Candidatus Omnitrophota bacterium]